ncbi:alpha/beta fold hydrolase [Deinococcus apachensis]|uniref:alpha/beta fold hydrolase n=1 Tax=Deinococcus apachensis TaxID=309886 RepID=UPI0003739FAB|nr:alpha/beta fold hydrolase [Deinococcus apachensis]
MTPKPTLVLLPGALQSATALAPLAAALTPFADVLPLDLPGHGGQPIPDVLRPQEMAEAVVAELDRRKVARAHLFGYSLGGYVGLLLARVHPERVASVFAHATKLAWTPEVAAREVRGLDADRILEKAPAFAATLQQAHAPQDWQRLTRRVADLLTGLGENPDVTDSVLRALKVPVHLSLGDHDRMVSLEETVAAYRALTRGRLLVLPGVTHPFEPQVQERLAPELRAFLQATEVVQA